MDILVHYATNRSNALEAYKVTHIVLQNSVKFKVIQQYGYILKTWY